MITEDYVSYEVAKMLKEKGFNEPIRCWYDSAKDFHERGVEMRNSDCISPTIMCPTHQMAMKWLREVHNIYIDISPTYSEVEKTIHFIWQVFDSNYNDISDCEIFYGKYEQACEAALKYSLENLI
jgi:hypothetical protein